MATKESKVKEERKQVTPTLVVNRQEFRDLCAGIGQLVIHGRRGLKIAPPIAQEFGENEVIFPDGPKEILFRLRFTRRKILRKVRFITADNSDRFDIRFYVNLKEL